MPGNGQVPEVAFPQHEAPPTDYWNESFIARLVLEEGCLRAASRLLIWPHTFRFDTRDGVVRIIDATGRIAAHVGDDVRFSRAPFSIEDARDRGWIHGLSADCPGPYWMVGGEVGGEVAAVSPDGPAKPPDPDSPPVHFPRHDAPLVGTDRGGRYFAGRLVMNDGCLRVEVPPDANGPGISQMLIWPSGFEFSVEFGNVRVVDGNGRVAAHLGDHVRLSGVVGAYQDARDRGLIWGMSGDCPGPYRLVGEVTAFDPGNEPTELRLSDPDVLFPRQRTTMATIREGPFASGFGQLVLDSFCLRLKFGDEPSYLVIWPPGFTPYVHRGVVHVRNGAGRIIAQVGDRIAGGGSYGDSLHEGCPGSTFKVSSINVLPEVEVYFPNQDGSLATDDGSDRFEGKLVLDGKCLLVDSVMGDRDLPLIPGVRPLLIWPNKFTFSVDGEFVKIIDATGRVVARVGDNVQFSAAAVTYGEAWEHVGLEEISPSCPGPYWAVGDDFAAFTPVSQPTTLLLTDPKVYFFRQKDIDRPVTERMTAAASGMLVLVDNCLRLGGEEVMVWPAGYTPDVHRGVVRVRNENGYVIANVGDRLYMGGGVGPGSYAECPGPAWHANDIRVAPDSTTPFDPRPDPDQDMGIPAPRPLR